VSAASLPCCWGYHPAGVAVDVEHDHYNQVESSLEFLQERLAAAEAAGATESEEYERSTAELHQQLEAQASKLVASQLRIATLKEELEQSKKRLEDEQDHEQQLLQRALQLEAEAEAAGRTVEEMQQMQEEAAAATAEAAAAAARLQDKQQQLPEAEGRGPAVQSVKTSHFALALAESAAEKAVDASEALTSAEEDQQRTHALPLLGYDHATQQQLQKQHNDLADLEAEQLLQQLDAVLELSGAGGSRPSSRTASPTGSTGGSGTRRPKTPDMALVRKHVEEMAKQYVKRLAVAEEELKAVRTVWQQAEAELAALRKQQPTSGVTLQGDNEQQQQQCEAAAEQDEPVTPQQGAQDGEGLLGHRSPTLSNWRTNWRTTDTAAADAAAADEVVVTEAASPAGAADESDDEGTDEYGCNDYYDDYDGSAASRSSWEEDQLQQLQHMQAIPPSPCGRAVYELVQMSPVFGQQKVSGSSHAAADAEHGMSGKMEVELPTPVFGGSAGPEPSAAVGLKGSLDEMNDGGFSGVPRALSPSGQHQQGGEQPQQQQQQQQQQSRGSWRTPVVGAVAVEALAVFAAAVAAGQQQQQQQQQEGAAQPNVAAVQQAAQKGVRSSNPYVHVHVHCKSPDKPGSA
jgi:hypothetical protein